MHGNSFAGLELEVHKLKIKGYANMVDREYEKFMMELKSDFNEPCTNLILREFVAIHYHKFQQKFHLCHRVYATVVATKYYSVPVLSTDNVEATEEEFIVSGA